MKKEGILYFILIFILLIAACKKSGTQPDDNIVLPDSGLTFNDHILPLFSQKCSSRSGCHNIGNPAANLELTIYNEIKSHFMTNSPSVLLLIENDADHSPLYQVLIQDDTYGVERMPRGGPYLNFNQTDGVKTWIDEGAIEFSNN